MMVRRWSGALVALVLGAACGEGEGEGSATMSPGQDCMSCHVPGGSAQEETFSAAGTVFGAPDALESSGLSGATVTLTDAQGTPHIFKTNSAGNFFAKVNLPGPLKKAAVDFNGKHLEMSAPPSSGSCNACHSAPGQNGAPGRLYVQ